MDNIIKKIELEIDGVGIVLTPEQAKKLHAALGELMGVKPIVVKEREFVPVYERPLRPYVSPWVWPYGTYTVGLNGNMTNTLPMSYTNGTAKLTM